MDYLGVIFAVRSPRCVTQAQAQEIAQAARAARPAKPPRIVGVFVEMDSTDRLLIPPERKSVIGDAKEIVLQSTGKCIEIWNRQAYDKMNQETADFASIVDKRLGELHGLPSAGDAD